MSEKTKVLAAMSGGVDSSVTAALLNEQGYEVIGATMSLWDGDALKTPKQCCGTSEASMAIAVCSKIGIPHYILEMKKEFADHVIKNFISEYKKGRTPNPCVKCNLHLKFDFLLKKAVALGCTHLATGHYSSIENKNGRYYLHKSSDQIKDQSYFLYPIKEQDLSKILFPLSGYTKDHVRELAEKYCLPSAKKVESQDICFVDSKYASFLEEYGGIIPEEGEIIYQDRNVGRHKGLHNYTIGQRRGIGVALNKHVYVRAIDIKNNRIILDDEGALFSGSLNVSNLNILAPDLWQNNGEYQIKVRYRTQGKKCRIKLTGDSNVHVELDKEERGITPGQSAVFYRDDIVIAGGEID